MYESFYGLREKPFNILPDPQFLYLSEDHQNAYSMLEYAVTENTGFAVLTGEIGSGKTTLLNYLLKHLEGNNKIGLINNTHVNFSQLMKMICIEFELDVRGLDVVDLVDYFYHFLLKQYAERRKVILIIDEAQNLSAKVLDQIRMLSNYDAEKQCLIQIILAGQPDLRAKLNQKPLEQLMQRVTMSHHLNRLNTNEVGAYIRHRLAAGGARRLDLFDEEAIQCIARYSKGIPRLINTLCEIGLVYGFAEEMPVVGKSVIESIVEEKDATGFYAFGMAPDAAITPAQIENAASYLENKIKTIDSKIDAIKLALTDKKVDFTPPPMSRTIDNSESSVIPLKEITPAKVIETAKAVQNNSAESDETEPIQQSNALKFTKLFEKLGMDL